MPQRVRKSGPIYTGKDLHPGQMEIYKCGARFRVVFAGRRVGKSELAKVELIEPASQGFPVAYCAPNYKVLEPVWEAVKQILAPITASKNESDREIKLTTGGSLDFWTLAAGTEGPIGREYKKIVLDEWAIMPDGEMWNRAIRPTMSSVPDSTALFLSTPRGHNHMWSLWRRGYDKAGYPDWASFQMPTSANPFIPASEIESAKRDLPEREFREEYLAEPQSDAGSVFRYVADCAKGNRLSDERIEGHQYVIGVDLASSYDFSVFAVLDVTVKKLVWIDRDTKVDYEVQLERLAGLCRHFNPTAVIIETNLSEDFVQRAEKKQLPVVRFRTGQATKQIIIGKLTGAFDRHEIGIPDEPLIVNELQAYEMERLPGGMFRYGAPKGEHDDIVMALALAWWGGVSEEVEWEPMLA